MQACIFTIEHPNGKSEKIELEADRVLIGSGAHCDIRLPPECATWEHLVITEEEGGMNAFVLPKEDNSATLDGARFRQGRLNDGAIIALGGIKVTYRVGVASQGAGRKRRQTSPLLFVLLLL